MTIYLVLERWRVRGEMILQCPDRFLSGLFYIENKIQPCPQPTARVASFATAQGKAKSTHELSTVQEGNVFQPLREGLGVGADFNFWLICGMENNGGEGRRAIQLRQTKQSSLAPEQRRCLAWKRVHSRRRKVKMGQ